MKNKNAYSYSHFSIEANDICAIISSYNRKSYLNRAINSVLSQSCQPGQLIIVDDGSTDQSPQLVEQLQKKFSLIQLISYSQNRGPSFARNFAVEHTKKKFLAFLDSDDTWHPLKLAIQIEKIQSSQSLFSSTQESWIRNNTVVYPPKTHRIPLDASPSEIFALSLHRCIIATSTVILSRELFLQSGGFNLELPICEDFELWLRCLAANSFCFVPLELSTKYGGRADQVSSQFKRIQPYQITALFSIWKDFKKIPLNLAPLLQKILLEKTHRELQNAIRHNETNYIHKYQKILSAMEKNHIL